MLSKIWKRITNEPALILGAVQAALTLAVVFGVKLTPEQIAGVLTFSGALLALLTRQLVVPVAKMQPARTIVIPPPPDDQTPQPPQAAQ
jgi:hypothetical protein